MLSELMVEHRVEILRSRRADGSDEQIYRWVAEERAAQLVGLGPEDDAVLSLVEKAGCVRVRAVCAVGGA